MKLKSPMTCEGDGCEKKISFECRSKWAGTKRAKYCSEE